MNIAMDSAGKLAFSIAQQQWNNASPDGDLIHTARFAGQEMIATSNNNGSVDLHFLGFRTTGFSSMDEAKNAAPVFAKQVLSAMSEKIVGAHEATMEATGPVRYAMPPLSLTAVVALASKEAHYKFRLIEESALEKLPLRFPVQVQSKQTRVFLEYQAKALGASLAGIAGAILDQVVKASLTEKS